MAFLTADVPFRDGFCINVVIYRVTAVAESAGGTLAVVGGIVAGPPVGVRGYQIRTPLLMSDVPLGAERKEVVADASEVPLFPLAPVDEGDILALKGDERVGLRQVRQDGFRMDLGILDNIGHTGLAPASIDRSMARAAGCRADVGCRRLGECKAGREDEEPGESSGGGHGS